MEGIFRLNGSAKRIKDLQELFDSPERYGKGLDWTGYTVHDAANVLRRYLNQLPEPIVPLEFYERFRDPLRSYQQQIKEGKEPGDVDKLDHAKAVETYQRLIIELPPLNKQLLLYILDLLAVFASKSDQNRMPSNNLSAIFQPGMLSHPNHDMSPEEYKLSQDVLIFLIENQDHFLFGMSGTVDEETMKEVQAGIPRLAPSTIRRSVSNASANTESHRKLDGLRRNVSVSSRTSRHSTTAHSPGTPTSMTGGGVHRSNTLPSKMNPVLASARYARTHDASLTPTGLMVSHQSSRSTSRTPSVREAPEKTVDQPVAEPVAEPVPQTVAPPTSQAPEPVNQASAEPVAQPAPAEDHAQSASQSIPEPIPQSVSQTASRAIPEPAAETIPPSVSQTVLQTVPQPAAELPSEPVPRSTCDETSKDRYDQRHDRSPNLFSATQGTEYVHTSTHGPLPPAAARRLSITEISRPRENLQTPIASPPPAATPSRERKLSNFFAKSPPLDGETRDPRQPNRLRKKRIPGSASMSAQSSTHSLQAFGPDSGIELQPGTEHQTGVFGDITPKPLKTPTLGNQRESASEVSPVLAEVSSQSNHDQSLRPNKSRTPSMNSRSSFTDQSDPEQPEEGTRNDRHEHRRSWRFHRSSKRHNEQHGLGLSSPPLVATNSRAEQSTSSIGSGHHQTSEHSIYPLSLDVGVQSTSSIGLEPEKKSLFGKFKAKVAQVRDGAKEERTKSPTRSENDPSLTSQPLSPIVAHSSNRDPSAEAPRDRSREDSIRSPVSPLPGAGLPPPIPEEPHSPVAAVAPIVNQESSAPVPVTEPAMAPGSRPAVSEDLSKEDAERAPAQSS